MKIYRVERRNDATGITSEDFFTTIAEAKTFAARNRNNWQEVYVDMIRFKPTKELFCEIMNNKLNLKISRTWEMSSKGRLTEISILQTPRTQESQDAINI